jgi:hypothetical protein
MQAVIRNAPPALKAFLDARAAGAPRDKLLQLGDAALAEQEEDLAKKQRLRLIVDNDGNGGNKEDAKAASFSSADTADNEDPTPDLAG